LTLSGHQSGVAADLLAVVEPIRVIEDRDNRFRQPP